MNETIVCAVMIYLIIGHLLAALLINKNTASTHNPKERPFILFVVYAWIILLPLFLLYVIGVITLKFVSFLGGEDS